MEQLQEREMTIEEMRVGKPDFDTDECRRIIRSVNDTLDVINGKWKLVILMALFFGDKRFSELGKQIPKITDRMLSKELRELEINGLVKRTVHATIPVVIIYSLTDYGCTLKNVIKELSDWGIKHRQHVIEAD